MRVCVLFNISISRVLIMVNALKWTMNVWGKETTGGSKPRKINKNGQHETKDHTAHSKTINKEENV